MKPSDTAAPVDPTGRITNLDTVRGVAVLGILGMNAVSYGLGSAPYFNLDAGGSQTWLDWLIGGAGEVLLDQKFMALFSMLFGAGIVLFCDRAEAKGRSPVPLSLWRNLLLLVIGIGHSILWDGDVLVVYALAAPLLIVMRTARPRTLFTVGTVAILIVPLLALVAQESVGPNGAGLAEFWTVTGTTTDEVGLFLYGDFFLRAVGMMLIGVGLYRTGVITGQRTRRFYVTMAVVGLGVGLPLAAFGVLWVADAGFSADVAVIGTIPNTLGTIPAALGYLGLISLWNARVTSRMLERVRAAGRMALTNYLTQTVLGLIVLSGAAGLTRSGIALFIIAVWLLQLAWSHRWLHRFRFGPAEWVWRVATYLRWQPLRVKTA